jgi:hypothetical protein
VVLNLYLCLLSFKLNKLFNTNTLKADIVTDVDITVPSKVTLVYHDRRASPSINGVATLNDMRMITPEDKEPKVIIVNLSLPPLQ